MLPLLPPQLGAPHRHFQLVKAAPPDIRPGVQELNCRSHRGEYGEEAAPQRFSARRGKHQFFCPAPSRKYHCISTCNQEPALV